MEEKKPVGPLPIKHIKLEASKNQPMEIVQYPGLGENSNKDEVFAAIQDCEGKIKDAQETKDYLLEISDRIREQYAQIRAALDYVRTARDKADSDVHIHNGNIRFAESELARLRSLYADLITRDKELDALHEELEFFERIRANSPWGEFIFQHQLDGAKQMAIEKRLILADVMGLGKTLTSIATCDLLGAKRILIVAPNDIVSNFAREVARWAPERNMVALGAIKDKFTRHMVLGHCKNDVEFTVLLNYESWRRDKELLKLLIECKFDTVIIDEAHNMKDPGSLNFKGVKQIIYAENDDYSCIHCAAKFHNWPGANLCPECLKPLKRDGSNTRCSVKNVYLMTGTTILNNPKDIWPLLYLVDNVGFSKEKEFLEKYCRQDYVRSLVNTYVKKWIFQWGGEDRLTRRLGHKYLRRTREDAGIKLPPQSIQTHTISFESEDNEGKYAAQRKVMRQINQYNAIMLNNADLLTMPHILAILTRTRQAITWPGGIQLRDPDTKQVIAVCDVEESIKVDYAEKLLTEFVLEAGQRCVLFSQFNAPLHELERRLKEKGIRAVTYTGATDKPEAERIQIQVDAAYTKKEDCEFDVVLANYKKGGTGLNFTNMTQTVVLDREWNPGKEDQAFGRTHRIGQTEETTVHIIEVEGTIDDGIRDLIATKTGLVEGFDETVVRISLIDYLNKKFNES